jgi:hypothetical protein
MPGNVINQDTTAIMMAEYSDAENSGKRGAIHKTY